MKHTEWLRERGERAVCQRWGGQIECPCRGEDLSMNCCWSTKSTAQLDHTSNNGAFVWCISVCETQRLFAFAERTWLQKRPAWSAVRFRDVSSAIHAMIKYVCSTFRCSKHNDCLHLRERQEATSPYAQHTEWLRERGGRAVCQRWGGGRSNVLVAERTGR